VFTVFAEPTDAIQFAYFWFGELSCLAGSRAHGEGMEGE
jgi:hypothetical protein